VTFHYFGTAKYPDPVNSFICSIVCFFVQISKIQVTSVLAVVLENTNMSENKVRCCPWPVVCDKYSPPENLSCTVGCASHRRHCFHRNFLEDALCADSVCSQLSGLESQDTSIDIVPILDFMLFSFDSKKRLVKMPNHHIFRTHKPHQSYEKPNYPYQTHQTSHYDRIKCKTFMSPRVPFRHHCIRRCCERD
jgi:hypothetical protein